MEKILSDSKMKINRHFNLLYMLLFVLGSSANAVQNQVDKKNIEHTIEERSFITKWITAGPFQNNPTMESMPDGNNHFGFYTDLLQSIGGEEKAILNDKMTIASTGNQNMPIEASYNIANENGIIDFEKIYGRIDNKAAYAYCEIYSEFDQVAFFLLGSDDGAKVWVNGELVHSIHVGRGLTFAEDNFKANLKKGKNKVLVKITQWVREWSFALEVLNKTGFEKYLEIEREKEDFISFLDTQLEIKDASMWNVFFNPGAFPELRWQKPYLVEKAVGKFPISVKWYNANLEEVQIAKEPGRYAYVAEGVTPDGIHIRRSKTIYCMPEDWVAWGERPKAYLKNLPVHFIDINSWESNNDVIADYVGRMVLLSILKQEEGAVLMSFLDEMKDDRIEFNKINTPLVIDDEFHLALKRKILGVENKWPGLKPPSYKDDDLPVLHKGTEEEAGVKPGTRNKLIAVCNEWSEESGEAFNIFIARDGVTIINEAFGERPAGKITVETTAEIASITKLLTGLLFAQFVDQGLISIDDPVGKFLPDFPIDGDMAITLRHCFTHTSGLWSHEEWGGVHNPWLDNVISNTLKFLPVGKVYEYNGMGYDLAGKVMEVVSGKSIIRLFREHLFDPLKLKNTILEEDLAFSCNTNAKELAVIGQMLLNKGSYNGLQFFKPQTIEKFMPEPLGKYYPGISGEQGIGITWMRQSHPKAGNELAEDETILSKNIIGHGSATASIFKVDFDNKLVITQTRRREGKFYYKYNEMLLLELRNGLIVN